MQITENTLPHFDGINYFNVTLIQAEQPVAMVFFAAGRGGSPLRHLELLRSVARQGCTVIAPHFEILASTAPTQPDLDARIKQLDMILQRYAPDRLPIMGIGHSIGCVVLLLLAGAKARTFMGHEVVAKSRWKFDGLTLLAPAVDFFRHPEASVNVETRVHLRAGGQDTIVTPEHISAFKNILPDQSKVEFYLDEDAGHFSYMDLLPPQVIDCQPDRDTFLAVLADEVAKFVVRPQDKAFTRN